TRLSQLPRQTREAGNNNVTTSASDEEREFTPAKLEGNAIRLEPLRREHAELLWQVAKESLEEIFRWYPWRMRTLDDFTQYVERILAEQERGLSVAFATVLRGSGEIAGSTRFMNMDATNRHVEIGSTWIVP